MDLLYIIANVYTGPSHYVQFYFRLRRKRKKWRNWYVRIFTAIYRSSYNEMLLLTFVHVKREMLRKERKMRRKETKKEAPRAPVVVMPPPPSPGRQFVDFVIRNFSNGQRYPQLQ